MSYRSREAPVPGSSVSETHPGFWADCIKKEQRIAEKWHRDYGHLYREKEKLPTIGYADSKVMRPSDDTYGAPYTRGYSLLYGRQGAAGPEHKSEAPPPKACDYSTPVTSHMNHVVRDPVTSFNETFSHYSHPYYCQNLASGGVLKGCISVGEYDISSEKSQSPVHSHCPKYAPECHSNFSSSRLDVACSSKVRDPSPSAQKCAYSSLGELCKGINRLSNWPPDPPDPKCFCILCVCVPCRCQKVREKGSVGPSEKLPPWPLQLGSSCSGNRHTTGGDTLRFHYKLSRNPQMKGSATRMYEERQR